MWCTAGYHNFMSHICAKGFLDSNFDYAVFDKISLFFKRNCSKIHIFTQIEFFKSLIVIFLDQLLFPITFVAGTCMECTFSFLPVVSRKSLYNMYIIDND